MMNLYLKPLALVGLSIFMITGCGASDEAEPLKQAPAAEETAGSGSPAEEKQESSADTTNDESIIRILEQNLKYSINGEEKENTAFLKHNDNQNYSMYVLPDYELTAEEPNKDVLFWSEDDSIFMRIELLPADADWESVLGNTKAQLGAVNQEITEVEVPKDPFFSGASALAATAENETVTAYLIKGENQLLKLTLFTKETENHTQAFIEMAKTIISN